MTLSARNRPSFQPLVASLCCDFNPCFVCSPFADFICSVLQMEIFCRAETTSALPTVIQRGVSSEIDGSTRVETTVQPALVLLLMAVMTRCGIVDLKTKFRGELEQKIEQMLKQARKVSLLASDEYSENMIGDRVSRFIVSRLAIAMDEMHEHEKMQSECSTTLYEADMMMALMLLACFRGWHGEKT